VLIELTALAEVYSDNFPQGVYALENIKQRANNWLKRSESNLQKVLKLVAFPSA